MTYDQYCGKLEPGARDPRDREVEEQPSETRPCIGCGVALDEVELEVGVCVDCWYEAWKQRVAAPRC